MSDMLSAHFSRAEFIHTNSGIPNEPDNDVIWERLALVAAFLEKVRAFLGVSLHVNSGYRSPAVNAHAHGSTTSAHSMGLAADIVPEGLDLIETYHKICGNSDLMAGIDQLILEEVRGGRNGFVRWIHVGIGKEVDGRILSPRHAALVFSPKTGGKFLPFSEKYV